MELILIALIGIVLATLYYKHKKTYSFWSDRGVKGPPPIPFFGNSFDIIFRKPFAQVDIENEKKYGKVYGGYDGQQPYLVVSDQRILEQIYKTKFSDFNAGFLIFGGDPIESSHVVASYGDAWKRSRTELSAAFTSSKLRTMTPKIQLALSRLGPILEEYAQTGKDFRPHPVYALAILDIIIRSFYSLDINVYKKENEALVKSALSFFDNSTAGHIFFAMNLPPWALKLMGLGAISRDSTKYFKDMVTKLFKQRNENNRENDFLQALIDARAKNLNDPQKGLLEMEMLSNATVFLPGSLDTTLRAISLVVLQLALHNDVQEKVYQEIVGNIGKDVEKELTYEDYMKLVYMEATINEATRMTSVESRGMRFTTNDTTIPLTDIKVPKFTQILVPSCAIHLNEEYFEDAKSFKPERFLPENKDKIKPCTFLTFGAGPRQCLGMRFAFLDMKALLVQLLSKYKVVKSPKTREYEHKVGPFIVDTSDVFVKLEKRSN